MSRIPVRFAVQKLSGEDWLVPDDRRRLRVKDITRKSIEDIYSFREIMETRSLQKIVEAIRNKDYDTAYFYLKRDHFDHSIAAAPSPTSSSSACRPSAPPKNPRKK